MKKTVVLGVSGGIAAFKAAQLTSNLIKKGYDVEVIMTQNATEFITPLTFESLTKHNVMVSTFEKVADRSVKHISIAHRADIFVLVPATANVIAKIVHGLADDMLTTTFLAADCPKVICPAMNTGMYENPVTQKNLEAAKALGYELVEPEVGYLACGDTGKGKLADITRNAFAVFWKPPDFSGESVCWSQRDQPVRPWIRYALFPTIPPGRWAMRLPEQPVTWERM